MDDTVKRAIEAARASFDTNQWEELAPRKTDRGDLLSNGDTRHRDREGTSLEWHPELASSSIVLSINPAHLLVNRIGLLPSLQQRPSFGAEPRSRGNKRLLKGVIDCSNTTHGCEV